MEVDAFRLDGAWGGGLDGDRLFVLEYGDEPVTGSRTSSCKYGTWSTQHLSCFRHPREKGNSQHLQTRSNIETR